MTQQEAEDPRFEDVLGRTVVIDLDQLDTVSPGGNHGAKATVRYKPRRGGRCFLLANGFDFVCREINRVLRARNEPVLEEGNRAELETEWDGECKLPALDIQRD